MKNQPLSYIVDESLDNMFVTDKRDVLFFFPWGSRKKGYLLENHHLKPKIRKFHSVSLAIYFVALALSIALTQNIWFIFSGMFVCIAGWLLTWHLYVKKITRSLPISNKSYSEIVLEKISVPDDKTDDESDSVDVILPAGKISPSRQLQIDQFSVLKRHILSFIFGITPINWGVLSFLTGMGMFLPISFFFPQKGAHPLIEGLYTATALFFLGLFGFIVAKTTEIPIPGFSGFIQWKLFPALAALVFWGLGLYFAISGLFGNFVK